MLRHIQPVLVTLFFLGMMALLVRDHVIPSWNRGPGIEIDQRVLADSWVNLDDFYEISLGEWKLGIAHMVAEGEAPEGDGYAVAMHIEVTAVIRARAQIYAHMNRRLELDYARVRLHLPPPGTPLLDGPSLNAPERPPGTFEIASVVAGRQMLLRIEQGDAVRFLQLPLDRPVTMADSIAPVLRGQMLTKGKTYTLDVYDPLTRGAGQVEVTYVADRMQMIDGKAAALKKVQLKLGALTTTLWVNNKGEVWRREIPLIAPSGDGLGETRASDAAAALVFQRLEPADALRKYPDILYSPEVEPIDPATMRGEDRGDITSGLSVFGMLAKNIQQGL